MTRNVKRKSYNTVHKGHKENDSISFDSLKRSALEQSLFITYYSKIHSSKFRSTVLFFYLEVLTKYNISLGLGLILSKES